MIESNFDRTSYVVPLEPVISELSALLRGEIAATEAYELVMESTSSDLDVRRLQEFYDDHLTAVAYWKAQLVSQGMVAENSSGPWGAAVEAFVATANFLGSTTALAALKEGEEHGHTLYEAMLESEVVTETQKAFIRDVLIPNQRRHIYSLESLKKFH
jgi:hypothetical protein